MKKHRAQTQQLTSKYIHVYMIRSIARSLPDRAAFSRPASLVLDHLSDLYSVLCKRPTLQPPDANTPGTLAWHWAVWLCVSFSDFIYLRSTVPALPTCYVHAVCAPQPVQRPCFVCHVGRAYVNEGGPLVSSLFFFGARTVFNFADFGMYVALLLVGFFPYCVRCVVCSMIRVRAPPDAPSVVVFANACLVNSSSVRLARIIYLVSISWKKGNRFFSCFFFSYGGIMLFGSLSVVACT